MAADSHIQYPHPSGDTPGAVVAAALRLRPMQLTDLDAVVGIEARAYGYPWSAGVFRDCVRAGYVVRVVERAGVVLGYGIMSVAAGEAHLLNLCIEPAFHGRGLASHLLADLLQIARSSNAALLFLEVRPSNAAARELYRRRGFECVGRRKRYYPSPQGREDALVLVKRLVVEPRHP